MSSLLLENFDYDLPSALIAQRPAENRSSSRLLKMDRKSGCITHGYFNSLPSFLGDGDLLVLNNTRVFPARLLVRRTTGGVMEILLLKYPVAGEPVPCLVKPGRRVREEERVLLPDGARLLVRREMDGFSVAGLDTDLAEAVVSFGQVPLPPYIRREEGGPDTSDEERYQTVYARHSGAVAAPTAGLHFDDAVLDAIMNRGVSLAWITLHVGPGTFQPVRASDIRDHQMEEEYYTVPAETAELIENTRRSGGRIVAAGTTVVRTLESAYDGRNVIPGEGKSGLFIYPGYRFSVVDCLLTNFHLPRSTLLMLVCAFAGTDPVMKAYREAVSKEYRFYSYGDAMFIE